MLVSDLDWTMVSRESPGAAALPSEACRQHYPRRPRVCAQQRQRHRKPAADASSPHFSCLAQQVDHNDATHDKLRRFNRLWLTDFAPDSLLVFSSGRSPELFHELAVRCQARQFECVGALVCGYHACHAPSPLVRVFRRCLCPAPLPIRLRRSRTKRSLLCPCCACTCLPACPGKAQASFLGAQHFAPLF